VRINGNRREYLMLPSLDDLIVRPFRYADLLMIKCMMKGMSPYISTRVLIFY
jgi:hypothetical protein